MIIDDHDAFGDDNFDDPDFDGENLDDTSFREVLEKASTFDDAADDEELSEMISADAIGDDIVAVGDEPNDVEASDVESVADGYDDDCAAEEPGDAGTVEAENDDMLVGVGAEPVVFDTDEDEEEVSGDDEVVDEDEYSDEDVFDDDQEIASGDALTRAVPLEESVSEDDLADADSEPVANDDAITDEELLEDDSQPSPQLWGEDVEIPAVATPVAKEPVKQEPVPEEKASGFVRRTKARELALQMLFQADVNPDTSEQDVADQLRERLPKADLFQFAWDLYRGVLREKRSLDAEIAATATNWKLSRMAPTDRNVLRMGAYELKYVDTPFGVVLDEAIDMAKKFGAGQSASFVNGVLDKLVPESKRPGGSSASADVARAPSKSSYSSEPASEVIPARASPKEVAALSKGSPIAFKRKSPASDDAGVEPDDASAADESQPSE